MAPQEGRTLVLQSDLGPGHTPIFPAHSTLVRTVQKDELVWGEGRV